MQLSIKIGLNNLWQHCNRGKLALMSISWVMRVRNESARLIRARHGNGCKQLKLNMTRTMYSASTRISRQRFPKSSRRICKLEMSVETTAPLVTDGEWVHSKNDFILLLIFSFSTPQPMLTSSPY